MGSSVLSHLGTGTPLNATAIASGALATIPLAVIRDADVRSPAGSISLAGTLGASSTGALVTLAAAPICYVDDQNRTMT